MRMHSKSKLSGIAQKFIVLIWLAVPAAHAVPPANDANALLPSSELIHFYTFIGAVILYVLNRQQKKQPISLFTTLNVDIDKLKGFVGFFIVLFDMLLSCLLGTIAVVALTSPTTISQAVASGLGMTGILSVHTKEITKEEAK